MKQFFHIILGFFVIKVKNIGGNNARDMPDNMHELETSIRSCAKPFAYPRRHKFRSDTDVGDIGRYITGRIRLAGLWWNTYIFQQQKIRDSNYITAYSIN